jgi:hypothetical protein
MCVSEYWSTTTHVTLGDDGKTSFKLLPRPKGSTKIDYPTEPVKLTLSAEDLAYLDSLKVPWLQGDMSFSGGAGEIERTCKIRALIRGCFAETPPAWLKVATPAASPTQNILGTLTNTVQPTAGLETPCQSPQERIMELEQTIIMQNKKLHVHHKVCARCCDRCCCSLL